MKWSGRMKVGDEHGDHGPGCDCPECRLVYGDEYMTRAVILDRRGSQLRESCEAGEAEGAVGENRASVSLPALICMKSGTKPTSLWRKYRKAGGTVGLAV